MDEGYQRIASGSPWTRTDVIEYLEKAGADGAEEMLFKVEQHFTVLAQELGCKAEWSVRFGDVRGFPADFQYDLDELRVQALVLSLDDYFGEN